MTVAISANAPSPQPGGRIRIDTTKLLAASFSMTAVEVGRNWIALLRGEPSAFTGCVNLSAYPRGWQATRRRVLERDGWVCAYCQGPATECDHVIPIALGGGHEDANLAAACKSCNSSKRDRLVDEWRG